MKCHRATDLSFHNLRFNWPSRGYHDFFVYTPSQFVKVDVYDSDIGPGRAGESGNLGMETGTPQPVFEP